MGDQDELRSAACRLDQQLESMGQCFESLFNSGTQLFEILKEYSMNSELKDDEDFCLFLLEYQREVRKH